MKSLLILLTLCTALAAAPKPNIVFLFADDQSFDTLGCYGNPDVKTPNIDKLSDRGISFDRHYNTTAICMASRASVMTGLYEYRHGTNFEHGPMQQDIWKTTYPMLLRDAGYMTAFAGKFGFDIRTADGAKLPLPAADFDKWGGGPGQTNYATAKNASMAAYADKYPHSTRSYGAFGSDFINEAAKEKRPFCLSISFKAPHKPATPDPLDDAVYAGKTFRKPKNFGREKGAHFSKQSQQGRQYERFHSWGYADKFDEVMAIYHQQIYAIDVAVGMVVEALEKSGTADNTVIIYTSDNGYFCGAHGYGSKVLPYEESSRAPLIIFDPRHKNSGRKLRSASLTGNIDFAPTILGLAGVPVPKGIDGTSLLPLLDDPAAEVRSSLQLINVWGPDAANSLSVVTKDWKYVHWPWAAPGFEPTDELYQLDGDSLELENLAANPEHAPDLRKMQKLYDQSVASWKADAVPYNNYQPFAAFFDRSIPWDKKQPKAKPTPKPKKEKPARKRKAGGR